MDLSTAAPQSPAAGTPSRGYARLDWIRSAAAAQRKVGGRLDNLLHHLSVHNLRQAFHELDGSRACGVDGVTKSQYEHDLEANLAALHRRIQGGGWKPRPSREVLIPKPQGGFRPLAIGCLEDKIVQTLVARILEAIYDPQFHRHSYGFREGKSAHQAVGRLYSVINERRRNCVVEEMDIEKFFNSMDQAWVMQRLEEQIADPHFLRLIRRLLRGAVLHENGQLAETERGTPQGSPVSPILANICLHFLLDEWFVQNYSDKAEFVRYADDAVFVFKNEDDARQFQAALADRLKTAGLNLNLDKSGIVPFSSPTPRGTISFLGFELFWGRAGIRAQPTLKLKTSAKKLARSVDAFTDWIKRARNKKPTKQLWRTAASKLRGHFAYFGVCYNQPRLNHFYQACISALFKWLNRRSQKRSTTWERFALSLHRLLPAPPTGNELKDLTSEHSAQRKHQPKSRMRETRTSGSVRSARLAVARPVFT